MIKYIADTHFFHKNIIRYDNRPWQNQDEMVPAMIDLWNKNVDPSDTVYILGDVVWSDKYDKWADILRQLNGKLFIVKGNHDQVKILDQLDTNGFITGWSHQEVVQDNGRYVVLNHSPMPFFVNMHHDNTYHLYGHVHISFDYQCIKHIRKQIEDLYQHPVRMYNVGCMIHGMDYVPRTLDEIIEIDKVNRAFEEGHEDDYLTKEVELGHDKANMKNET